MSFWSGCLQCRAFAQEPTYSSMIGEKALCILEQLPAAFHFPCYSAWTASFFVFIFQPNSLNIAKQASQIIVGFWVLGSQAYVFSDCWSKASLQNTEFIQMYLGIVVFFFLAISFSRNLVADQGIETKNVTALTSHTADDHQWITSVVKG